VPLFNTFDWLCELLLNAASAMARAALATNSVILQ
jgi:hypothetical protein